MDIQEIFKSDLNFLNFIKQTGNLYREMEDHFKGLVAGLETQLDELLLDGESVDQDYFLVPEVPKTKKEPKGKRESRATKKTMSISTKTNSSTMENATSENDETFRRSSRIASKTKLANESVRPAPTQAVTSPVKNREIKNISYLTSPSLPPAVKKIRRSGKNESLKLSELKPVLDDSICTTTMKNPLGTSTPTESSEEKENIDDGTSLNSKNAKFIQNGGQKTPVSDYNRPIKGESVKKRVEEFEKRTQAAVSSATKIFHKTPEKKKLCFPPKSNNSSKTTDSEKDMSAIKGRCTRNTSKVLQEKSANIKLIKEKGQEAQKKKEGIMKASAEETKRKREERSRKAAAQREAVEKEKLESAIKLEKEKEEKLKLIQKQKEEKLKLEALKKKQLAAAKAAEAEERRRKEEAAKLLKLKEMESKEHNDYGIEHVLDEASSEDEEKPKKVIPSWASKENRRYPLLCQAWMDKKTIYRWFHNENLKYPKLEQLFSAEVKTRPRTSSAFWNSRVCFDESFPIN